MSRFSTLSKYLSLYEALRIYFNLKSGNFHNWRVKKLEHPFSLRNNPYDYATFEEVVLKEGYQLPVDEKPATIIDAGANIGLTAAYLATRFPLATIVALEPEPGNFDLLKMNTSRYARVKPIQAGLWSHETWLTITNTDEGDNAFRVDPVPAEVPGAMQAFSVPGIMEQHQWQQVDLIKIDVEGAEKEIFEGDTSWLRYVKIMVIELHDRFKAGCSEAVFAAVAKHQFEDFIHGENHVFINKAFKHSSEEQTRRD